MIGIGITSLIIYVISIVILNVKLGSVTTNG